MLTRGVFFVKNVSHVNMYDLGQGLHCFTVPRRGPYGTSLTTAHSWGRAMCNYVVHATRGILINPPSIHKWDNCSTVGVRPLGQAERSRSKRWSVWSNRLTEQRARSWNAEKRALERAPRRESECPSHQAQTTPLLESFKP
jgi:hypothetical protein